MRSYGTFNRNILKILKPVRLIETVRLGVMMIKLFESRTLDRTRTTWIGILEKALRLLELFQHYYLLDILKHCFEQQEYSSLTFLRYPIHSKEYKIGKLYLLIEIHMLDLHAFDYISLHF